MSKHATGNLAATLVNAASSILSPLQRKLLRQRRFQRLFYLIGSPCLLLSLVSIAFMIYANVAHLTLSRDFVSRFILASLTIEIAGVVSFLIFGAFTVAARRTATAIWQAEQRA